MTISFFDFLNQLNSNPAFFVIAILTLGVIFVNGWTDAPNSVATCIATRSLQPGKAIMLAAVFDFIGAIAMTLINSKVAYTIYSMVDFKANTGYSLIALCAAMVAIVIWGTAASAAGIPTSEGHALIAGISGAAIALQGGISGINLGEWMKVVYGLFFSVALGLSLGFLITRVIERIFRHAERRFASAFFRLAQILASAFMAFMHGAQDGQKFMGVFMLGLFLADGNYGAAEFKIPLWMMVTCSLFITAGTLTGGYKIIKTVGLKMVKLENYQGFAADTAAALSLLASSMLGFPVSTTHTKSTAIIGVGISKKLSAVNWNIVRAMVLAWAFTFPGCGLLGYSIAIIFMKLAN